MKGDEWVGGWVPPPPRGPASTQVCLSAALNVADVRRPQPAFVCVHVEACNGASVCPTCTLLIPGIQQGVCQGVGAARKRGNNDKLFQKCVGGQF